MNLTTRVKNSNFFTTKWGSSQASSTYTLYNHPQHGKTCLWLSLLMLPGCFCPPSDLCHWNLETVMVNFRWHRYTNLEPRGKGKPQLKNNLDQTRLCSCWRYIFLIANWCSRAQPIIGDTICRLMGLLPKKATQTSLRKQARKKHSSAPKSLESLLPSWNPLMIDYSLWPNNPSSPSCFLSVFYHSIREAG